MLHRVSPGYSSVQKPFDLFRNRFSVRADRFVPQFERGRGTQYDRRPEVPRMLTKALGGGAVGQHFIPVVTEMPRDRLSDLTGVRGIGAGTVEDAHARHPGHAFHQGGSVDRCCGVVPPWPESDRNT
ncbi:MAG TPA: hypothetical protein VLT34_03370, partial [Arthrobacter sp.]|nr:hypothetical protein [Arthrobacter sp.]